MSAPTTLAPPVELDPAPADAVTHQVMADGARWLTAGTLVVGAVNYAYAFLLTRLLSTSDYAGFAAGQALLLTAGTVAAVSVPWVLAQQLGRAGGDEVLRRRAVWFATLTNVAQGLVGGLVVGVVASTFLPVPASLAVGVSALLVFLASSSLGWFQAAQRFRAIAVRGVSEVAGKAAVGLALVGLGAGAGGALAGFGVGALLILVAGAWLMRADYRAVSRPLGSADLWTSTRGVAGIQGLVSVLASVDVVLVAVLPVASGQAASYQASMILARVPLFLAGAVAAVAFTMLGGQGLSTASLLRTGSRLYLYVAVPLALVLATVPADVLAPLFPGSFDAVQRLLPVTAVAGVLIGFLELITTFFQAEGHYAACTLRQLAGVVVTLVAVPVGWHVGGVLGIAVAACLGAACSALLLGRLALQLWPGSLTVRPSTVWWAVGLGAGLLALRPLPLLWLPVAALVLLVAVQTVFVRRGRHAAL